MLVVLSEMNVLNKLNQIGVYPDEFYTDFDLFKNKMVSFEDATILIIVAGTCRFYRKLLVELLKVLDKRYQDDTDDGVKQLFIVTDSNLPMLKQYYKFQFDFTAPMTEFNGWDEVGKVDVLGKLKGTEKKSELFLSDFDKGNIDKPKTDYLNRHNSEDEYVRLIKVPNIKQMLQEAQ